MSFKQEVYQNAPLAEVVFETRFPGNLDVDCERNKFWKEVHKDYPKVLVPYSDPKQAPALAHYKFGNEVGDAKIMIAMNSIGYSVSNYPGYDEFKKEALRIHEIFDKTFAIDKVNRIGWRYINIIPFVRRAGIIPLGDILKFHMGTNELKFSNHKSLNLAFQSQVEGEGATATIRLESIINALNDEAILLDIDYGKEGVGMFFKNISEYLGEAHNCARQLFEDLITDEYRQYLRGDVL